MFWPKAALSGFKGMNNYDPLFGENLYNDSFHCGHGIHIEKPKEFIKCLSKLE